MVGIRCSRRRGALTSLALSVISVVALSACSFWAPVQTNQPYVPADGLALSTPTVQFENLVVVAKAADQPGVLVGQAVNTSPRPIQVSVTVAGGQNPGQVTLPAGSGDGIKSRLSPVSLGPIPQPPGALVQLEISLTPGGRHLVDVPILPPDSKLKYYNGITP